MNDDRIAVVIKEAKQQYFNTDRKFEDVVREAIIKCNGDKELLDWMIAHPDEAQYIWGIIRREKKDFRTEMKRWRAQL